MKLYQYICKDCHYERPGLLDKPAIGIGSYSTLCPECGGQYFSEEAYNIVIDTLQKKRDELWKMTQSNMNIDMFNIMDQIRLEQIDQLDKAMKLYYELESNRH